MAFKRRAPVTRSPVDLLPCRGCSAPSGRWQLRPDGVFCSACGIDDPNGIGRPRPATADELALAATRVRLRAAGEDA